MCGGMSSSLFGRGRLSAPSRRQLRKTRGLPGPRRRPRRRRLHLIGRRPAPRRTPIDAGYSHQALSRTRPLLIADFGMGRAKGAAGDHPTAQTKARLAGRTIWPTALAEPDRQDGGRRAGRRCDRRCRMRSIGPDPDLSGLTRRRPRRGDLLTLPLGQARRHGARTPDLRSADQTQAIDLAQDGATGDIRSQGARYPGGCLSFLPEGDQSLGVLGGPDGGGHDGALGQQAQSARPHRPFLLLSRHEEGPALSRRAQG